MEKAGSTSIEAEQKLVVHGQGAARVKQSEALVRGAAHEGGGMTYRHPPPYFTSDVARRPELKALTAVEALVDGVAVVHITIRVLSSGPGDGGKSTRQEGVIAVDDADNLTACHRYPLVECIADPVVRLRDEAGNYMGKGFYDVERAI